MIKLKHLSKFYYSNGMIASGLSKVNLELSSGEFVVITGESGSGKSTLLNVISGLDSYEEGEMYIDGEETSHYTTTDFEQYRRKYIGNIFQNFQLIGSYSVYENVETILLINGYEKNEAKQKVNEILSKVGLTQFAKTKASKLSGGQKQRVSIARALAKDTAIIVADEPTGNLDSESALGIVELLGEISKEKLVVVVTHNFEQFEEKASRVIRMHDGKIVEDKKVKEPKNVKKIEINTYNEMSSASKIRLGARNTFNIIQKFFLLLLVFMFLFISVTSIYTSFQQKSSSADSFMWNSFFRTSADRIVIKKSDNSILTEKDYEEIQKIDKVSTIKKDDMLLDRAILLERTSDNLSFASYTSSWDGLDEVDLGRLPKSDNEAAIGIYERELEYMGGEILNATMALEPSLQAGNVKVVGIKYTDSRHFEDTDIYLSKNKLDKIRKDVYNQSSERSITIDQKIYEGPGSPWVLKESNKVKEGEAIIAEEMNGYFANGNSKNKNIEIDVENIFYQEKLDVKVSDTYSRKTFEKKTGAQYYDENTTTIFISEKDYNKLFDKGNYQYSVYAEDKEAVGKVVESLEEKGYKAIAVKDISNTFGGEEILNIIQVPFNVFAVLVIFFIAYFVLRIVLKSRGIYFAILRILGMSKDTAKRVLEIELFIVINIAYVLFIAMVAMVKTGIVRVNYLTETLGFLSVLDILALYGIVLVMSYLISNKFSKSIFDKSAMSVYREEA